MVTVHMDRAHAPNRSELRKFLRLWGNFLGINHRLKLLKGLTCYQMMVISGSPCDNNSTTVSTADAKIDYVSKKVYRFKNIVDDSIKLTAANNITAITAATENVMNVDTGAATTFGSV